MGRYVEVDTILKEEWQFLGDHLNAHGQNVRTNSITMGKSDLALQNIADAQTLSPLERHLKEVQKTLAMMGQVQLEYDKLAKFDMYSSYIDTETYRVMYRGVVGLKMEHLTFLKSTLIRHLQYWPRN